MNKMKAMEENLWNVIVLKENIAAVNTYTK